MKLATLLVALSLAVLVSPTRALAQESDAPEGATIKSAQVSGLGMDNLSPGLRQSINALAGTPLSRAETTALADRIEAERPDVVVAVRSVAAPDGEARVVFLVARISDDRDLKDNINSRYIVDTARIEGIDESKISQEHRDAIKALVGRRLDSSEVRRLREQLEEPLDGYGVRSRTERGREPGHLDVVFEFRRVDSSSWLPFAPTPSKLVFQDDQGWSGVFNLPIGGLDNRVALGLVIGDDDDLVEEFTGFSLRLESRKVVSDRLGLSIELSRYEQYWQDVTLAAMAVNSQIPELYGVRLTTTPQARFAMTPDVWIGGGISATELESLVDASRSQMATAAVVLAGFEQNWTAGDADQRVGATANLRHGADALASDLVYTRFFTDANYRYTRGKNIVLITGLAGRVTGDAPLFERFTLGDTTTLRGWNKYDIAPTGGDRVLHSSFEFRSHGFAVFVDTGSVWDSGTDAKLRVATGFGFHLDNVFFTLGLPVNADEVTGTFMMGVRF